jgi:pimeloyl-ACP methyl ester carboxylesterase
MLWQPNIFDHRWLARTTIATDRTSSPVRRLRREWIAIRFRPFGVLQRGVTGIAIAAVWALGIVLGVGVVFGDEGDSEIENPYKADNLSELYLKFGRQDLVDLFEPGEFIPEGRQEDDPPLLYRLFVPRNIEKDRLYPLIVWVHGFGDTETVELNLNTGQLKHTQLIFTDTSAPENYPFYILAAQNCDSGNWLATSHGELLLALIDETIERHVVDPDRVTMVGISSGGTSCWDLAARRPDLFAGIAPLASIGGNVGRLGPLVDVPVWAFHSEGDGPEGDRRTVEYLNSRGGCARLTEIVGKQHDCWTLAFKNYGLLAWLLARRKGEDCPIVAATWPEASRIDSLLNVLPGAVTLLLIVTAIVVALRKPPSLQRLLRRSLNSSRKKRGLK